MNGPMAADLPTVSIIMPIRNEEAFLDRCLGSVAETTYPIDRLELLVVDGMSTDRSREIAESFRDRLPGLRVIENPARIQAVAFNLGLSMALGELIVRMDAHTLYDPNYVSVCVDSLLRTGAENVGGPQRSKGDTPLTRAIAFAVSSRFGAGDASYRYTDVAVWADTVYLGSWRRKTLECLGGMRPDWAVNEDYELNIRLRKQGGRILVTPAAKSTYFVRGSIPKLARQYFRYGLWKVRTLTVHPASIRWRQLVAPGFVSYLVLLPQLHSWFGGIAFVPIYLYLTALLWLTASSAASLGAAATWLPMVFPTIHLSWGVGFLLGWLRWLPDRFERREAAATARNPGS